MDEEEDAAIPGRYLSSVHLENFQSHRDSLLEFSPGFNLLIGTSNAGKTAIMRALHLLYHNGIRGDDFIRIGADEARITATFSDGTIVQRIRGTKRNAYLIHLPDGSEASYDRIGTEVPDEVRKALGAPPVDEKSDSICIADSDGPNTHFLVYRTMTELPRAISHITGISDFEEAVQLLATRARTAQKQAKDSQSRIDTHNTDLQAYNGLDEKCAKLERLGEKQILVEAMIMRVDTGERILFDYAEIRREGKITYNILQKAIKLSELSSKLDAILTIRDQLRNGEYIASEFADTEVQIKESQKRIAISENLSSQSLKDRYKKLQHEEAERFKIQEALLAYKIVIEQENKYKNDLVEFDAKLQNLAQKKSKIIDKMREAGQWCNACNRPLLLDHEEHNS